MKALVLEYLLKNEPQNLEKHFDDLSVTLEKYPYFQAVGALLLKASKQQNKDFERVLQKVALMTQDRTHLFKYLSTPVKKQVSLQKTGNTPRKKKKPALKKDGFCSFFQWLDSEVPQKKLIVVKDEQSQLINRFIETNPKMPKPNVRKNAEKTSINSYVIDEKIFMTETLAMVYVEQQLYEKAKNAYKILSLKYPEKKALFADKILSIENNIKIQTK